MGVISVQSHVSFGRVGNAAAVYPMQRLGVEVWPVYTTLLAHHPGHGGFHGEVIAPKTVGAVLDGLRRLGTFGQCEALLSGYLGSVETGEILIEAWKEMKAASPDAIYCCAAVMGDRDEGVYVHPDLPAFFREAMVPAADVIVANAFEAGQLTGIDVTGPDTARHAAAGLGERGPSIVIISSVPDVLNGVTHIGNLLHEPGGIWWAHAPQIDVPAKGAGDFMTAAWLARYLGDKDSASAVEFATAAAYAAVERSTRHPMQEIDVRATIDLRQDALSQVDLQKIDGA